jgi:hypothetical protein
MTELRGALLRDFKILGRENPDYAACRNCQSYKGTVWIEKVKAVQPLTLKDAKEKFGSYFIDTKRRFRLSTHASDTLSIREMTGLLDLWERQDDFVPDLIIVDYADLLVPDTKDFRQGQNEIWKGLRRISQQRHALVSTVTQADADSYEKDRLKLKNFSEDKRKYAHVTAMYGLNQDAKGREKELGLMRINELVIREGEFSSKTEVTILQDLWQGRPLLSSYH